MPGASIRTTKNRIITRLANRVHRPLVTRTEVSQVSNQDSYPPDSFDARR
jgi:hypothetical protein